MADKKITDLPVLPLASIVPATDVFPVVNGAITKQVTLADAVLSTFSTGLVGVGSVNGRAGIVTLTSTDVGLANVNNTSDANKPVSTAQQTALDLKANLASPTFTGTVGGITKTMVGLGSVDNTSDVNKPVGTATQQVLQSQLYTAFTTAGTSTAYTLTPSPAIAAYVAGESFFVTFNAACGASPTLTISGVATPPNLVKQLSDGTYTNLVSGDIPINHRSRVTLLSATQALVEKLPPTIQTSSVVATTSGTSIDFTNIPAGTKRITLQLASVSTNGTSNPLIQIGPTAAVETTGYAAVGSAIANGVSPTAAAFTTGFGSPTASAANALTGVLVLSLLDAASNTWVASGNLAYEGGPFVIAIAGRKLLAGPLARIRITTVGGTDTFDAGTANILYE